MPVRAKPVEQVTGREQLTRLRARYAELQARISERGGDAERIEALRSQAESLNPDMWVTEEEARTGVEAFEPKIRELRAALGLRRRRRSRRGGRQNAGPRARQGRPTTDSCLSFVPGYTDFRSSHMKKMALAPYLLGLLAAIPLLGDAARAQQAPAQPPAAQRPPRSRLCLRPTRQRRRSARPSTW